MSIPTQFEPLGSQSVLPRGWEEAPVLLDGLTSLDTGCPAKTGYKVYMKARKLVLGQDKCFLGFRSSQNQRVYYAAIGVSAQENFYIGRSEWYLSGFTVYNTGIGTSEFEWISVLGRDESYGTINEKHYNLSIKADVDLSPETLIIGAFQRGETSCITACFYRTTVQYEDSSELLYDFRGVVKKETGEAGIYDFVNKRFLDTIRGRVKIYET